MGKLTAVDINPFFGKISLVRFKKDTDDRLKEACEAAILRILTTDRENYPVDIIIVPRCTHIAEMEAGEGKEEAQAQERIDIAAAIQNALRRVDREAK